MSIGAMIRAIGITVRTNLTCGNRARMASCSLSGTMRSGRSGTSIAQQTLVLPYYFARRLNFLIFEFDSGIEQGARSAAEVCGSKNPGGNHVSLLLTFEDRIISDPVCVKNKEEVIFCDDWLSLGQLAEPVFINKQRKVL